MTVPFHAINFIAILLELFISSDYIERRLRGDEEERERETEIDISLVN